jgi:hypothetical protein
MFGKNSRFLTPSYKEAWSILITFIRHPSNFHALQSMLAGLLLLL